MIKRCVVPLAVLAMTWLLSACHTNPSPNSDEEQARAMVKRMSVREKIGQKIMMAFRYWCEDNAPNCRTGMLQYNNTVGEAISKNKLGGIILFSNNLATIPQMTELVTRLKQAAAKESTLGLFIALDQEGGNVVRLPREIATSFPGNMALGAAYQATHHAQLAYQTGQVLAAEVAQVGFNVNLAPVVDVNSNPLNPIINVRAFSDDPDTVGVLGSEVARGIASQQVISVFKHFPGHGDTVIDSHYGLPMVNNTRHTAYAIDLAPYKRAIRQGHAPDMIMSAHIQYPALDSSLLTTQDHKKIIAPATLSRKIQHDILRKELGFQGVTITDALDMQGIAHFFSPSDAVIKAFQAGVDIALMPTEFARAAEAHQLPDLIDTLVAAIDSGQLSLAELNQSVERIVRLKLQRGIRSDHSTTLPPAVAAHSSVIGHALHKAVENEVVKKSITLIKNAHQTLPLTLTQENIHVLTPWQEQADAIKKRFNELGYLSVSGAKMGETSWPRQKEAIDNAAIVIVATASAALPRLAKNDDLNTRDSAARLSPPLQTDLPILKGSLVFNVEEEQTASRHALFEAKETPRTTPLSDSQFARYAMEYAKSRYKTVIHLTLRTPYDAVAYDDVADATLATYSYYGYQAYWRGPSLPVVVDMMVGRTPIVGKLPVNLWEHTPEGSLGRLKYPRGFGLTLG